MNRWLVSLLLLAIGCEAASPDAKHGDRLAEIRAACGELATSWCAAAERCSSATFRAAYGDTAGCLVRRAEQCERTRFGAGSSDSPARTRECARAWDISKRSTDEGCTDWLKAEVGRKPGEACTTAGGLGDGKACLSDSQCKSGSCSRAPGACGTCSALRQSDDDCFDDDDCAPTLACRRGKCVAFGIPNADCGPAAPCSPELACIDKKCAKRLPEGWKCMTGEEDPCQLWPTQLACRLEAADGSGVCVRHQWRGQGEACNPSQRGTLCEHGLVCQKRSAGFPKTELTQRCVPFTRDRLPCGVVDVRYPAGGPCHAPAVCFQNRCQIPDTAACSEAVP